MKAALWVSLLAAGGLVRLMASPVSIFVDSMEMLEDLRIQIEHEEYEDLSNGDQVVGVKVSWRPVEADKDFPPRFDLILFAPKSNGQLAPSRRMQVSAVPNEAGVCELNFSVFRSETRRTQLLFWNGQHQVHGFSLSDFLSGFPK